MRPELLLVATKRQLKDTKELEAGTPGVAVIEEEPRVKTYLRAGESLLRFFYRSGRGIEFAAVEHELNACPCGDCGDMHPKRRVPREPVGDKGSHVNDAAVVAVPNNWFICWLG